MVQSSNDDSGVSPATSPYPLISFAAGGGTESFRAEGRIDTKITSTGTDADTAEKTLWTFTLPANTLSADGITIIVEAGGAFAANANTKTLKLAFGAFAITLNNVTTAPNGVNWVSRHVFKRITATAFMRSGYTLVGSAAQAANNNTSGLTLDPTIANIIKITGTNGTASLNDIVCNHVDLLFRA